MRFVANVGDFDAEYAVRLKRTGFTGAYHICRLGEGKDTKLSPAQRIRTLDAVKKAGMELYYCVEPIGPEHTPEEIVEEIFRPKEYPVEVMAVMKRVCVRDKTLFKRGNLRCATGENLCGNRVVRTAKTRYGRTRAGRAMPDVWRKSDLHGSQRKPQRHQPADGAEQRSLL